MISDVITLVSETYTKNSYGVDVKTEQQTDVFCEVSSVSASEWFEGNRADLNPEYRFIVFFGDYDGQKTCIYNDIRYGIYRTYRANDRVELYAERKSGA